MKVVDTSSSADKSSLVVQVVAFATSNFLLVAVLALFGRCLYKKYASPLRNVPGPWLASVSRLWKGKMLSAAVGGPTDNLIIVWSTYNGHTELDHIALHKKYGENGIEAASCEFC